MSYQMTIFDIISSDKPKVVPYGYTDNMNIIGRELTFKDLKNYIGKQIVCTVKTESNLWYRVYKVIEYFENCDTYYKRVRPLPPNDYDYGEIVNSYIHDVVGIKECMACYEPAFACDRIALSSNGKNKADSWISESYDDRFFEVV